MKSTIDATLVHYANDPTTLIYYDKVGKTSFLFSWVIVLVIKGLIWLIGK